MPSRGVMLAILFLLVFFAAIASALGYIRFRLPVYYSHEHRGRNVAIVVARAGNENTVGGAGVRRQR